MRMLLVVGIACAACGSTHGGGAGDAGGDAPGAFDAAFSDAAGSGASIRLPPTDGKLDYQLGGAYPPPAGVVIVSRDRSASPAPGLYNICYVNGFQIQPDETAFWMTQHADLILRDAQGNPVIDAQWNEMLIDVSTPAKRGAVAAIIATWIDGCKQGGFDAIEIDNLDSYSRSKGLLVIDDNVAAMALFSTAAHADGLAIAQKNTTELVARRTDLGTDFSIAEECNRYTECQTYLDGYGDHVLMIEYRQQDLSAGCTAHPGKSLVLRDVDLVAPPDPAYVFQLCP